MHGAPRRERNVDAEKVFKVMEFLIAQECLTRIHQMVLGPNTQCLLFF